MVQKDQKVRSLMKLGFTRNKLNNAVTDEAVPNATQVSTETKRSDGREVMISVEGLCKSFGDNQVLKSLDLSVYEGELFGILSKSGEGKTALLECIVGASNFDEGRVTLNGFDVQYEPIEAKSTFGYVAELPLCYESMTGYDYLEFVANIYRITEGDLIRNMQYLCERLDLPEQKLCERIETYSVATKQKLCIVASVIYNPKIWILDNPSALLDTMTAETLKKMLRDYANHSKTVLVATNNVDLVAKVCDKAAIIHNGTISAVHDLNKEPNKRIQLSKIFADTYRRR